MNESDPTYQRIYRGTQKKLQRIAKVHKPRVTVPVLLDVLTDRELKKYPELREQSNE